MGGLSDIGDIAGLVGSIVGMAIAAIVLLTFAPIIAGDINAIALQSTGHCVLSNGELTDRAVKATDTTDTANITWAENGASFVKIQEDPDAAGECASNGDMDLGTWYTSKGTKYVLTTDISLGDPFETGTPLSHESGEWKEASKSLTSLAGGSLVSLLFGAMAILLPAGALGFLGYFGATIVKQQIGGGTLAVAIGATVAVVIIGSILPSIFAPLDALFIALDGNRFFIYSQGIGQLGSVLGNFLGISLIGGLITLGILLWQGRDGSSSGTKGML